MALVKLDLSKVQAESETRFTLIPAGAYNAAIVGAEPKETKAKTGAYIALEFEVLDGDHKGARFGDIVNIANPNEDAVRIGLARLKRILELGGHKNPNSLKDTDELIGLAVQAVVSQEKTSTKEGKEYTNNRVDKYKALEGGPKDPPVIANQMIPPKAETTQFPWHKAQ